MKQDNETELTDPMLIKKPNVAADESMYWLKVATTPRGPGPALGSVSELVAAHQHRGQKRTRKRTRQGGGYVVVESETESESESETYRMMENEPKMKPIVNPTPATSIS